MEKKLGEGGMGAVYLAEDLTLSRRVAIKFMSRSLLVQQGNKSVREGLEKRFIREAKSAAAINHPNLAQIYEANFESEDWYIAMEFIDGDSLYDLITDGKTYTIEEIINICRQTVSGLDFAWENYKIVHRDIKPHNIMLTKTNLVKIVDLGLAKPLESELTDFEMPDLTGAGTPIGTPQYMAPEQATGQKDINFLVDIFALGATLYEVCCGKKAFSGNTAPMIYMSQVQKKYKPLRELREDTPDFLVDLVDRMLEPKPENRIGSYSEILDVLSSASYSAGSADLTGAMTGATSASAPSPTIAGHMSAKTIGMDQFTVYHATDKLIRDRYRILKPIGKSRAGMVYHCMDTKLSVECIVKSLFPGREYSENEMPRIKENFQRLMGFSHPNLVQIRDLQEDEETGEFFVVMELLDGHNLRDYTHRLKNELDTIDIKSILPILHLIAKALDNVSKTVGVIHHDLLPEDIYLLQNDSKIKFLDYGITGPAPDHTINADPAEYYKYPMASPDYMSPELWQHKSGSRQSDQYSLAVIIYEVLADRLPFWLKDPMPEDTDAKGKSDIPLVEKQLKFLYERVQSEPPKPLPFLKKHENAVLLKALAKDPHERYSSCEAFITAMEKKGGLPIGAVAALSGMALVVAVGALIFMKPAPEEPPAAAAAIPHSPAPAQPKAVSPAPQTPAPAAVKTQVAPPPKTPEPPPEPIQTAAVTPSPAQESATAAQQEKIAAQAKTVAELKRAYAALRELLQADPVSAESIPDADAILAEADKLAAKSDFVPAIKQYKEAIATGNNIIKRTKELKVKQQLDQMKEATTLQRTLTEQRDALLKNEEVAARMEPINTLAAEADALLEEENFTEAIRRYRTAIDRAHDISNEFNREMRETAEELKPKVTEARNQLNRYRGLSPEISENIVKVDVTMSLARESINREEFSFAVEQYNKALEECKAILTMAENKFQAKSGADFTDPKTGMAFVWIESMKMWVAKYEVTNAEYRNFKPTHDSKKAMGFSLNRDRQPVLEVSYYDAVGFCQWLNAVSLPDVKAPEGYSYRLPSREEWETIARCGEERLYPWGNSWPPPYGNFGNQEMFPSNWQLDGYADEHTVTCEVTESGANEWGLFGVAGNAWEWTTDLKDGKRAVLGGDWTSVTRSTLIITLESAYAPMDEPFDNIGIRLVLAPEEK